MRPDVAFMQERVCVLLATLIVVAESEISD